MKGDYYEENLCIKEDFVTTVFADLHYAGKARFFYVEGKDNGFELIWNNNEQGE